MYAVIEELGCFACILQLFRHVGSLLNLNKTTFKNAHTLRIYLLYGHCKFMSDTLPLRWWKGINATLKINIFYIYG